MRISEISKRYAKALYTVLKQNGQQNQGLQSLQNLEAALTTDKSVLELFTSPNILDQHKEEALQKAFAGKGLAPEVAHFANLLVSKKRISEISNIVQAYKSLVDDEQGITRGVVKSAKPLAADQLKSLEQKMNSLLKKKVALTFEEDKSLLGGVVAHVGGWTFDDSLQTHLKNLNDSLIK